VSTSFAGKVALITGSSRGIGAEIARNFAQQGADVIIHYSSSEKAANALLDECISFGVNAWVVQADLSVKEGVSSLFSNLPVQTLDFFVNNAAGIVYKDISSTTEEDFINLMMLNNYSCFFGIKAAIPLLNENGRIINISSCVTRIHFPEIPLYASTKGFIDTLTLHLAPELAPKHITVNAVAPGATDTDMSAWIHQPGGLETLQELQALPGVGQPQQVADLVMFLASERAKWITGQIIDVSGGLKL
jgi:NAD(P)-dependent dehydrogenase (short-subunit alcohol dehydrogenase family)